MRLLQPLKRLVPRHAKRVLESARRRFVLDRAVRRTMALRDGELPDRDILTELWYGWGNMGWSANTDYLYEMSRLASKTPGPILECGSGLTTLLLGILIGKRNIKLWSLEHDSVWFDYMRRVLKKHRIEQVELCFAPLRDYGTYSWYDPPLKTMPRNFAFVVCDGPPETTPGGRYGLLAVLGDCMSPGCTILLDDVDTDMAQDVLQKWIAERSPRVSLSGPAGNFAVVNL